MHVFVFVSDVSLTQALIACMYTMSYQTTCNKQTLMCKSSDSSFIFTFVHEGPVEPEVLWPYQSINAQPRCMKTSISVQNGNGFRLISGTTALVKVRKR